jgi:hypothetical protein
MTNPLALLYISWIGFVGASLFLSVDRLEPNPWVAILLKCALLAAGGAAGGSMWSWPGQSTGSAGR